MSGESVEGLLQELVRLVRVQVFPVAKQLLREEFFEDEEPRLDRIKVYANLDGSPQRDVAEEAEVSQASVSAWSREWKRKGLVDTDTTAVFSIYDFFPELER